MKNIKLFESFSKMDDISKFIDVLDEPRQNPEGFLLGSDDLDFWRFERAGAGEGLKEFLKNPGILDDPEVRKLMDSFLIDRVESNGDDSITVYYLPMSKSEWVAQHFSDYEDEEGNSMSYEEYLENFGY